MIIGWQKQAAPTGLRWGAVRFGLDDPRCRDPRLVGAEVVALADVACRAPVPETEVITAPLDVWQRHLRAHRTVARLADQPLSIRCWLLRTGELVWHNGVWNNIDPEAVWDSMTEIAGHAARSVPGDGGGHRLVFALQRFVPAVASLLIRVAAKGNRVHIRVCWGIAETLSDRLYFDHFVLYGAARVVEQYRIAHKHSRTVPAQGGTRTVDVPREQVSEPVLSLAALRSVVASSRAWIAGRDDCVELEVAWAGEEFQVVACSPLC